MVPAHSQISEEYDNISTQLHDDDSQDNNSTIDSASFIDAEDGYGYASGSRKRKRASHHDLLDQQHTIYADALLDYFILSSSEEPTLRKTPAPYPPENFQVDKPIDDQGHTALHWGSAMGDIQVVRHFLGLSAYPGVRNSRGETPLIRAVLFTNNYEKDSMFELVKLLLGTIKDCDDHEANVLHHIVMTTNSHAKQKCARYYLDVILNKLAEVCSPHDLARVLNHQDINGDTPLHIASRHNAKKCVRALQGRSARGDIINNRRETADQIWQSVRRIHQDFVSSSPVLPHADLPNGREVLKVAKTPASHYHTDSARSFSQSFEPLVQEKTVQISLALDSELQEKDEALVESQRLLEKVENERHGVKQSLFPLYALTGMENDEQLRELEEEEQRLKAEGMAFSEQIQHKELHQLVRTHEKSVPAEAHGHMTNGDKLDDREAEQRLTAGLELASEQDKRRKLTTAVVEAQGLAGMGGTGEALKRLVSSMVELPIDQIPVLIPELLEELEQAKMDVAGAGVVSVV